MADYRKLVAFLYKEEGGLSKNPKDRAAKQPVPDGSGYHTNKGVTWFTFVRLAPQLGYTPTPELFYKMPKDIWGLIYKKGFWDWVGGDKITSQPIAEMMADFGWGSGPSNSVRTMQVVLSKAFKRPKIDDDGIIGPKTLGAINAVTKKDEKGLFTQFTAARKAFLENIVKRDPAQEEFIDGWLGRVNRLYKKNEGLIKTVAFSYVGIILVTTLAIGSIALISHYSNKETQVNGTTV